MRHIYTRRTILLSLGLLVLFVARCQGDDVLGGAYEEGGAALEAADLADDERDPLAFCPFSPGSEEPELAVASAAALADDTAVTPWQPELVRVQDRIRTKLRVEDLGSRLRLHVQYYNPYRCHWYGDLYVEHEDPAGNVATLARRYRIRIPGGSSVGGTLVIIRPEGHGEHRFVARAYASDGQDREVYDTCRISATAAALDEACLPEVSAEDALLLDERVLEAKLLETPAAAVDAARLSACPELAAARGPMFVDLWLWVRPDLIEAPAAWENISRLPWKGDVYVEMIDPDRAVHLMRRDLGMRFGPGIGLCTIDEIRRPTAPGRYVFRARALRRDGSAEEVWTNAGTTEIIAVCNRDLCELIAPEQTRARSTLTGPSTIHLESDFFSEFTRVTMRYGHRDFDITDLCRIRQYPSGQGTHMEVRFDTFELPIGPRTWARYTIQLHPMPVIPPGAKTSDSLWIRTNGPE